MLSEISLEVLFPNLFGSPGDNEKALRARMQNALGPERILVAFRTTPPSPVGGRGKGSNEKAPHIKREVSESYTP